MAYVIVPMNMKTRTDIVISRLLKELDNRDLSKLPTEMLLETLKDYLKAKQDFTLQSKGTKRSKIGKPKAGPLKNFREGR